MNNIIKESPSWAKGILVVFSLGAIGFIGWKIYKKIQENKDTKDTRSDEKDLAREGQVPSYPQSAYSSFANRIEQAGFAIGGTNEDAIYSVFNQMKNDLDIILLIKAFGKRRIEFSFQKGDLSAFLESELNDSEIKKVNSILESKKIKFRF